MPQPTQPKVPKAKPPRTNNNGATATVWMTIQETAHYLNINTFTVRAKITDGSLPAYRLGSRIIRLRKSDVDAALERM